MKLITYNEQGQGYNLRTIINQPFKPKTTNMRLEKDKKKQKTIQLLLDLHDGVWKIHQDLNFRGYSSLNFHFADEVKHITRPYKITF